MSDTLLLFDTPRPEGAPTHLTFGDDGAPVTAAVYARLGSTVSVEARLVRDMRVHLEFALPPLVGTPADLTFGGTQPVGEVYPPVLIEIAALLDNTLTVSARVWPLVKADIAVLLDPNVSVTANAMVPVRASIAATLENTLFVTALGVMPVRAEALALLSDSVTVTSAMFYDVRVTPYLDQRAASPHQTALPEQRNLSGEFSVTLPHRLSFGLPHQPALPTERAAGVPFEVASRQRLHALGPWQKAVQLIAKAAAQHQKADSHLQSIESATQTAVQSVYQTASPMQTGVFHAMHHADTWQWAQAKVHTLTGRSGASRKLRGAAQVSFPWQVAGQARNGKSRWPLPQPEGPTVYPRDGHLLFECPPLAIPHLVFGARACYLPLRAHVVVPFLRTYVTINSILLRRVSDGLPITAYGFGMSLDWQSWTWSWSTSIPASQLPLVRPGSSGDPIEVEALVNGVLYRLCVEGLDSQRTFAKGRIGIKGRGTAAILDQPYAPVLNFGNAGPRTAQQLMSDALTINGVGIGWDVDWGLTDWLVPGNAWTHQGTYISAILDIAGAAGGYVQPHATEKTLHILPKYPEAPWNWADITPDFELPGIATVEGIDWRRKAAYNRIHVSGIGAGVLGQVTRAGTAGDSVAPMVTHSLITDAVAARQRGMAELSDTGKQAHVSLKLPVLEETGLIMPGKFVRYSNGSEMHFGLTRSISLDWSRPVLRQTISVETHV